MSNPEDKIEEFKRRSRRMGFHTKAKGSNSDRARVIKKLRDKFEIYRGDYENDDPTPDPLVNLFMSAWQIQDWPYRLYMSSRHRAGIKLGQLLIKASTESGLPVRAIQALENEWAGDAFDTFCAGKRGTPDSQMGLVFRMGDDGLFVYGMQCMVPPQVPHITFCISKREDRWIPEYWRAIFPLDDLLNSE